MRNKYFLFLMFTTISLLAQGQEKKEEPKFGISFSGFVKTDIFYDSRQTVNIREGHFLLYPENKKPDLYGNDINAKDQFGILSIQTRLTGKITGPDVLKAKSSALIEADFFGNENSSFPDVNGFRLRHAIIKLNWQSAELLIGQYWHPLFIPECFPDVVSFNTGAPFQPFSRNPQIRFTKKAGDIRLIVAAAEQRDFSSNGPDGASTKYLRNAVLPDINIHLQYSRTWNENNEFFIGIGGEYKQLVPRLYSQSDKNLKDGTDSIYYAGGDKVKSFAVTMYSKLRLKPITIKAFSIYGSNLYDLVMLGGYAVQSIDQSARWSYDYIPVKNYSFWAEISTNGKIQAAVFTGYTKNLGTGDDITGAWYSRGMNINSVFRISPRMIANFEKLRIATELEFTSAQYGTADSKGLVNSGLITVSNLRPLLAFYYFF